MIYVQALSALALVLGLMGLFYYLAQRFMNRATGMNSRREIQIVERVPLGYKRALILTRVGHERFLLGVTESAISILSTVTSRDTLQESPAEPEEASGVGVSELSSRRFLEALR